MKLQKVIYIISILLITGFFHNSQASELPEGFTEKQIAGSLDPTALAIAEDGRVFLVEKNGAVWIIENDIITPEPVLKLTVDFQNERGLGGITLDPDFETNNHIYLYYTVKNENRNRVSRFTVAGNTIDPGSESIILDLDVMPGTVHNGGAMTFTSDGKLYIATGDGSQSSNSQELSNLLGKVLRINKDGSIPSDNPFYDELSGKNKAIYAYGLRNPFSFDYDPATERFYISEVGRAKAEEINVLERGANYGWPMREGYSDNNPQPKNYKNPIYTYNRQTGCAIVGAMFYNPENPTFPEKYHGKFFFADYCEGFIKVFDPEKEEVMETFATDLSRPIGFAVAKDGSFYYIDRGSGSGGRGNTFTINGSIKKVMYSGTLAPHVSSQPSSVNALVGDDVEFTVKISGQEPFTYQWFKNDVALPDENGATLSLQNVNLDDNGHEFYATISNEFGSVTTDKVELKVINNTLAEVTIDLDSPSELYRGGDTIRFSGNAVDAEDGNLDPSSFIWWIEFHHDDHTHPSLDPFEGAENGYYVIPRIGETSDNVWYRIYFEAKDSDGFSSTTYEEIFPLKANFELATQPENLSVNIDGSPIETPITTTGVVGITRSISVAPFQEKNNKYYFFKQWSDGTLEHEIEFNLPEENTTWTAIFREASPGFGDGLTGNYYESESDFSGDPVLVRIDEVLDFDWEQKDSEIPEETFNVSWTGLIQPLDSGQHTFYVTAESGIKLWINEVLIIDEWESDEAEKSGEIFLEAGKLYEIKMEYARNEGDKSLKLEWETEKLDRRTVASSQLYSSNLVTSIDEDIIIRNSFQIYPVPADDFLNITGSNAGSSLQEISIHNTLGALVLKEKPKQIDNKHWQINVSELPAGIYFIRHHETGNSLKFLKN